MPNQPRDDNPPRTVRIDDALWAKVKAVAAERGVKVSVVIREALERLVTKT